MLELKEYNILYVEDNKEIQEVFSNLLNFLFKKVYTASNGLEAINIIEKQSSNIDLVITDIKMPIMDGYDLVKNIRGKNKDLPIIVNTAYTNINLIKRIRALNIQGYFSKPIDLVNLTNMTRTILI